MKVRPILAARATAGALLMAVTVAACTGGTPSSSAPSIFTPTPVVTPTSTSTVLKTPSVGSSASAKASLKPSHKASHKATAKPKPSATVTIKATPSHPRATPVPKRTTVPIASPYPTGAPQTGGGGTAGLQDGLLFGVGGAAIFAGLGSLGYRRRLRRKQRAAALAARTDDREHTAIR